MIDYNTRLYGSLEEVALPLADLAVEPVGKVFKVTNHRECLMWTPGRALNVQIMQVTEHTKVVVCRHCNMELQSGPAKQLLVEG